MTGTVIFKDLPATFPEDDQHKNPAAISSIVRAGYRTATTKA
jgi:hypothetical protein